jgi:EAL and modified HD-GYP domain-containing signal transduction protein
MSFVTFFKRLLGLADQPAVSRSSVGQAVPQRVPASAPKAIAPAAVPAPAAPAVMVHRQEMLDKQGRLAGYHISLKGFGARGMEVQAQVCLDAFKAAHVKSLAVRRLAVMGIQLSDWCVADFASLNEAHTVYQIDLPDATGITPAWLAQVQQIRGSGAGVAFACNEIEPGLAPALSLATHCFVSFASASIEGFEHLIKALRQMHPHLKLAVDHVSTWPERRLCVALGAEWATGSFLSTIDEQDKAQKLSESRMVLMELLNLVREDADAKVLADVAKHDPGVAVRLLSMANAPAYGLSKPVTGIDQAITLLGRETLYRWLAISVFSAGADRERDKALLEVALTRARFLELVALSARSKQEADELFLVGLLSFIDTLLSMPLKDVLASMSLPAGVRDVLLKSEGPYGPYLLLSLSVEKCQHERASQLADKLGMPLAEVNDHRSAALVWAEEAVG